LICLLNCDLMYILLHYTKYITYTTYITLINSQRCLRYMYISAWSRPFVKASVITLFIGTSLGSIYMLVLSGLSIPIPALLPLHREIQTSAVTLLIMGVMYMLVPRIRSIRFEYIDAAKVSLLLMLSSLVAYPFILWSAYTLPIMHTLRISGLSLFASVIISMLRVAPRSGKLADYYFILALVMLLAYNSILVLDVTIHALNRVYIWLSSMIFVILGVQYKVVPVFLNNSRPMQPYDSIAFILAVVSALLLLFFDILYASITLIALALVYAYSIYIMRAYRIPDFLINSDSADTHEKVARIRYLLMLLRISYMMLTIGVCIALLYSITPVFALYDLAIHMVTMGFIGVTIMNFMPIMLPPILGRNINYVRFNGIPLLLLLAAIGVRILWNTLPLVIDIDRIVLGVSGMITIVAMLLYIRMIHRAMDPSIDLRFDGLRR
jgi:hypothetical protein